MNEKIIPFGKYKGQPIEVLQEDKQYLSWLQNQDWFKKNYANFNTIIINNFQEPSETPEHNRLVNYFLDDNVCNKLFLIKKAKYDIKDTYEEEIDNPDYKTRTTGNIIPPYLLTDSVIEPIPPRKIKVQYKNIWHFHKPVFEHNGIDVLYHYTSRNFSLTFAIEVKPAIGDDYPAILRQMNSNGCNMLIADSFTAKGATLDQVKEIFIRSNKQVYLFREIL